MQPDLFSRQPHFDGSDLTVPDERRLTTHLERVKALMRDGQWRTLEEIARAIRASEAGASARLRDLRKQKFGAYTVERRRIHARSGAYEYRLKLEPLTPWPNVKLE